MGIQAYQQIYIIILLHSSICLLVMTYTYMLYLICVQTCIFHNNTSKKTSKYIENKYAKNACSQVMNSK